MKGMKEWTSKEIRWYQELCMDFAYADLKEGYPEPPATTSKEHLGNLKSMLKRETNEFKKELLNKWIEENK